MISYAKYGYLFILPFFLVYAIFMIYPLINTILLSFKGNGSSADSWVGFQNYQYILFGEDGNRVANSFMKEFWRDFGNTLILWIGNFVVQIILSLLLAVWFSDNRIKIKGTGFFKVVVYMPNIITAASVASLFLMLFANNKYGAINSLLLNSKAILEPITFLNDAVITKVLVMFIQSWMWFGNTMLLLLSGIYGIDPSIYEAASIDGSSGANTFFKITMPILKPIFIYVFITSMIGGLQMFDIPYLLHEGNTVSMQIETVAVFIYKNFHQSIPNYGISAAASVLLFIVTGALGLLVYKFNTDSTAPVKKRKKSK
ncbi:MAG: carbohydrate ABC transporter permease [Oscillospiraceae bacterium]